MFLNEAFGQETNTKYNISSALSLRIQFHYAGAKELLVFHNHYKEIHGYLSTIVCTLGIIANFINIIVLTRKYMVSSTNCILTGIAISNGLTLILYLPFAMRFYCLYGTEPSLARNTFPAMKFLIVYACISVVLHTISIWLTVTLAVFRYIFIKYPKLGPSVCSMKRAKLAVIIVYVVVFLVCLPNFATLQVTGKKEVINSSSEVIWHVSFKLSSEKERFVYYSNFWIQAVLVKMIPSLGLTVITALLVKEMKDIEAKRQSLFRHGHLRRLSKIKGTRLKNTNRTTSMLIAVVVCFLLTEFPQGILNILNGLLPNFVTEIYKPLGDLLDIMALVNSGINFILFCSMSAKFRETFYQLFLPERVVTSTEETDEEMKSSSLPHMSHRYSGNINITENVELTAL